MTKLVVRTSGLLLSSFMAVGSSTLHGRPRLRSPHLPQCPYRFPMAWSMPKNTNDLASGLLDGDLLASYRTKIWILFGAVCVFVFLPGSIYIFIDDHRALAASVVCMLATFVLN